MNRTVKAMNNTVEQQRWDQEIERFLENFSLKSDVMDDSPALWDFTLYFRAKLADLLTRVEQKAHEAGYREERRNHLHEKLS